jgi:hypothetical protein
MKVSHLSVFLFGAVLLFSTSAFARDTNKGTLNLTEKVTVDGKALDSGKYKVEWNGNGPSVEVSLIQDKQTVATFPAHVTEEATANPDDAFGSAAGPNGSRELTSIYPAGKHFVLRVQENAVSQPSTAQPSK